MQGILELDIVSGSGVGHETPVFGALSDRRRDSQSTVAGQPSCGPEKEADFYHVKNTFIDIIQH